MVEKYTIKRIAMVIRFMAFHTLHIIGEIEYYKIQF